MATDPEQIRGIIAALLAELPEPGGPDVDLEDVAVRLDQAHDLLVAALQSVDRNPAGGAASVG